MPTWHELREHARSKYQLTSDDEDSFGLVWAYEPGRTQLITVGRFTAFEQDWVEFRSYVCKEDELSPRVALRKNMDYAVGTLALDSDGDYLLVHRAPVASLDPDEFALPLRMLATMADDLEQEHTAKDDY